MNIARRRRPQENPFGRRTEVAYYHLDENGRPELGKNGKPKKYFHCRQCHKMLSQGECGYHEKGCHKNHGKRIDAGDKPGYILSTSYVQSTSLEEEEEAEDKPQFVLTSLDEPDGSIEATLKERGQQHGRFGTHSVISQSLKNTMAAQATDWWGLPPDMREALEMIQHKVARILNGGQDHADSWRDIAGYAMLVEQRLNGKGQL